MPDHHGLHGLPGPCADHNRQMPPTAFACGPAGHAERAGGAELRQPVLRRTAWQLALASALWILGLPAIPAAAATAAPTPVDMTPVPPHPSPSALPEGWQHGAFMEIFVRAYQDSDGDGIGDLRGLTSRLDYLQALGVKGLWLMPIQASADRDHGYATIDHRRVEPQYGTLEDFDTLISEAHRRGIGVVMDYILNHAARQHPVFQAALSSQAGASGTATTPWQDWFVWSRAPAAELKAWTIFDQTPWYAAGPAHYFATFGQDMPDFNMRNPDVVRYHEDSLRFWLNRGLDGYRLDAVPHLIENSARDWNDQPESRALTGAFTRVIKAYPHRHVVCEATAEPQAYAQPGVCGSAFAFGLEHAVVQAAQGQAASPQAVAKVAAWFTQAPAAMATMLSNHDIFAGRRAWDQFGGDERRYRLAAATYLLLPGTPFIYYGEEIGQAGRNELPGDEPLRAPMSWTAQGGFTTGQPFRPLAPNIASHNAAAQAADPDSLFNFYRAMLALRNSEPSLARGSYLLPVAQGRVLAFQRDWQGQRTLVALNYGDQAAALPVQALQLPQTYRRLHPSASEERRPASALVLPPQSVQVYRLR